MEIGVGHRIGSIGPDVATSTDGVPGFHEQAPLRLAMSSFWTEILHEYLGRRTRVPSAPLRLPGGIGLWCGNDHRRPGRAAGAPQRAAYPRHQRGRPPAAAAWPLGP